MYTKTDDNLTLTIIYTPSPAYALHTVDIIPHKTHFHSFIHVDELELLLADDFGNY